MKSHPKQDDQLNNLRATRRETRFFLEFENPVQGFRLDNDAVKGSSSRGVRLPQTFGNHEANTAAAKESLNERGFFDQQDVEAPAQQARGIISARRRMALDAKPKNTAKRASGGNTYDHSILGNPVRIAASEPLAAEMFH